MGRANDRAIRRSVGLSGKAMSPLPWPRSARPTACATEPRTWLSVGQTGAVVGRATPAHARTNGTLDADRRLCPQPVGPGTSVGHRDVSALGNTSRRPDPGSGSSGHAHPFDTVGHPGATTATTRKSARPRQRLPSQACCTSSSHSQNKQKTEKAQDSDFGLSLLGLSFSGDSSFFALS